MTRVLVSAGEPSGDAHAGAVVRELRRLAPDTAVDAVGGDALRSAGARLIEHSDALSAFGTAEAVGSLPRHLHLLRRLDRALARGSYDVAVLVDYPGFHLRVARRAAVHSVPVLYYVAPQLWAWGAWRTRQLRSSVRHVALILPFEESFFRAHSVPCSFVGHPLLDRPAPPQRDEARRRIGVTGDVPVLAVLPGSRPAERRRHWEVFATAAERLWRERPELRVVVAGRPSDLPGDPSRFLWCNDAPAALAAADAALCKSGTSTLEAALAGTPMVVAYRVHPVTWAAARRLVSVPHVSLVNLIAGSRVVPELLQADATPDRLVRALLPLLDRGGPEAAAQRVAFQAVVAQLGRPGAARRVAELTRSLAA